MSSCCGGAAKTTPAKAVSGTSFTVDDMTCSHCAGVISRALKEGMPGVEYSVDLETQRVTVAGDAAVAEALIRDAGYDPRPAAA